ncbi:MAG: 30S ribosomal protein S6 [Candidatus Portiera sp.]|nr:30S ribosomal protein S6 [Portiera sp.]
MEKRHYEVLLVLRHLQEDKADTLIKKYESLFTKDGEITRFENWGVRQLAYHIDGFSRALYVLFNVHCPASTVDELEKLWKFDDMLLRHMIVRCKDAVTEESPILKQDKAKASSRDANADTLDKEAIRSEFKQGLAAAEKKPTPVSEESTATSSKPASNDGAMDGEATEDATATEDKTPEDKSISKDETDNTTTQNAEKEMPDNSASVETNTGDNLEVGDKSSAEDKNEDQDKDKE